MKYIIAIMLGVLVVLAIIFGTATYVQIQHERHSNERDLQQQTMVLSHSLVEPVALYVINNSAVKLQNYVNSFPGKNHVTGILVYRADGTIAASTTNMSVLNALFLSRTQSAMQLNYDNCSIYKSK